MNKKYFILVLFIFVIFFVIYFIFYQRDNNNYTALRICPDKWYDNKMPRIISEDDEEYVSQYFIIDGERREISEFDVDWIIENCEVNKPELVF